MLFIVLCLFQSSNLFCLLGLKTKWMWSITYSPSIESLLVFESSSWCICDCKVFQEIVLIKNFATISEIFLVWLKTHFLELSKHWCSLEDLFGRRLSNCIPYILSLLQHYKLNHHLKCIIRKQYWKKMTVSSGIVHWTAFLYWCLDVFNCYIRSNLTSKKKPPKKIKIS